MRARLLGLGALGAIACAFGCSAAPNGSVAADAGSSKGPVDAGSSSLPRDAGDAGSSGGFDPTVAPGGNFDLSHWRLLLPIGPVGSPTSIVPAQLQGPTGFQDSYFFTDPTDGSMSFWDPENGTVVSGAMYPRSELGEVETDGTPANWTPAGTNTLTATLKVTQVPDHVTVGQIHVGIGTPMSTKPLLELYYSASGAIVAAVGQDPAGGQTQTTVGNVPLGTKWSYVLGLSGQTITVAIDGVTQTFAVPTSWDQEEMYFRAGDYDQSVGTSATIGAKVQFYALTIVHGS
jgi:hypothetical protein